ncbi:MAG TPA: hypothetical protein VLD85_13870 [Anaeromyxobacteraceae bacterium]|nr:hypothetical protein [Anaeromyxobacteraceae bacterium]
MTVPIGWSVRSRGVGDMGYAFLVQPSGSAVVVQITLAALPPDKPMRADEARTRLEVAVRTFVATSVEKVFDPRPLSLFRGSGWVVQLTDASLVGKPPEPGNFKVMRNALAVLDDHLMMVATVQFDDPSRPEVGEAMALLSTLRVERSNAPPARPASGAFEFTVPESRLVVKIPDIGLRRDDPADGGPRYFKLSRSDPQLILSGWLEPASRYKGLKGFWESESRSPAFAGPLAPARVEMLHVGPWEVVAYDVVVPGGTSAHLRAERVQAGTWIDLHLSGTSGRPASTLRRELLEALRRVEVVEK